MYFSKSKYCLLWQCPKILWLAERKPEEAVQSADVAALMATGTEVGELARGLFGDFVDVTVKSGERLDLPAMIRRTAEEMEKGTPVICEASFAHGGLYCAVDILRAENGGWAIYEVKSASDPVSDVYIVDVAYQKYVLEQCGVRITNVYLVTINSQYERHGELDISRLFNITCVTGNADVEQRFVASHLAEAEAVMASEEEPDIDLSERCSHPYKCAYWGYCSRHLPSPSVFDLYKLQMHRKLDCYRRGLVDFESLQDSIKLTPAQERQIDFALHDRGTFVDRDGIRKFLDTLSYPLYFLDFETMQSAIPLFDGTRPYQQTPFQYSLHYIEHPGGELRHTEFLAQSGTDPRRELAEQLCRDIPMGVCVTAYNKSFECGRTAELAQLFPDLAEHLLNIESNIKDLLVPFRQGCYYNRAMGGSFSIKSVLPAIYPDDPALDYHNLEGVHNGSEAMSIFPQIKDMPPDEQEKARNDLLKYCELDTFAMVKVWEELVRVAE